jgi:tripeptide aminopeptidase
MDFNSLLPSDEIPAKTEGYEGFFHLTDMSGTVEKATLSYIVRDHDAESFEKRCALLRKIEKEMNEKYKDCVKLSLKESYRNMKEVILPHMHLIKTAEEAAAEAGIVPRCEPIRGGTDGARLSFMGLPCPNLGTGGYAFHGPFEHISAEGMHAAVNMILGIVTKYASKKRQELIG